MNSRWKSQHIRNHSDTYPKSESALILAKLSSIAMHKSFQRHVNEKKTNAYVKHKELLLRFPENRLYLNNKYLKWEDWTFWLKKIKMDNVKIAQRVNMCIRLVADSFLRDKMYWSNQATIYKGSIKPMLNMGTLNATLFLTISCLPNTILNFPKFR